jgi:hypothetical protein
MAARHGQLVEDVVDVVLDRLNLDVELRRDLLVAEALFDEMDDLDLAPCEMRVPLRQELLQVANTLAESRGEERRHPRTTGRLTAGRRQHPIPKLLQRPALVQEARGPRFARGEGVGLDVPETGHHDGRLREGLVYLARLLEAPSLGKHEIHDGYIECARVRAEVPAASRLAHDLDLGVVSQGTGKAFSHETGRVDDLYPHHFGALLSLLKG